MCSSTRLSRIGLKRGLVIAALAIWGLASLITSRPLPVGYHLEGVQDVAYCPNGVHLAVSRASGVELVDPATAKVKRVLSTKGRAWITVLAWRQNGDLLAAGRWDGTIVFWDDKSPFPVRTLKKHTLPVTGLAFSHAGKVMASCSRDLQIHVYDMVDTPVRVSALQQHTDWVECIAFDPTGQMLVSGGRDGTICLWDVGTGHLITKNHSAEGYGIRDLEFAPDGVHIASVDSERGATLKVWRVQEAFEEGGGRRLVSTGSTGVHIDSGGHFEYAQCVVYICADVIATGGRDGRVRLWRLPRLLCVDEKNVAGDGPTKFVEALAYLPERVMLCSGTANGVVRVHKLVKDTNTGELRFR